MGSELNDEPINISMGCYITGRPRGMCLHSFSNLGGGGRRIL